MNEMLPVMLMAPAVAVRIVTPVMELLPFMVMLVPAFRVVLPPIVMLPVMLMAPVAVSVVAPVTIILF